MKKFIIDEVNKMLEVYIITPERIISDYRKEKREIDGYKGRQILELLQNADDASGSASNKSVLIDLNKSDFTISNNGEAFTKEGVKSLMYSDLSPKAKLQNKIGNKGTGFRSVLSWAQEIHIISFELSIGFSSTYAVNKLKDLMKKNDEVKKYIKEKMEDEFPIATLVIPKWIDDFKYDLNYDTMINLKLLPKVYDDIKTQLEDIDCETLLFLNNIESLTLRIDSNEILFYKNTNANGIVDVIKSVNGSENSRKQWHVKKSSGKFNERNYEIAIAYADKMDDRKNILYSYFKTDVAFPFPAIIHGTFNLDATRNHLLKNNEENVFLINRIGDLLIEIALHLAGGKSVNYAPLLLLAFTSAFAPEIKEMNFEEKMIDKIKNSKLLPTINNKYISFKNKPKYYKLPLADILPKEAFSELLLYTDNNAVLNILSKLFNQQNGGYNFTDFTERINRVLDKLKIRQKVMIIKYIKEIYKINLMQKNIKVPYLIVDTDGNSVNGNEIVFISPKRNEMFAIPPAFSNIRLLNERMYKYFKEELSLNTPREIAGILNIFGVREYAFDTVVGRVISKLNKRVKNNSKAVKSDILKAVNWFYSLYINLDDKTKSNRLNEFWLLNRQGNIMLAGSLFIGGDYGNKICENLLGSIVQDKFIADIETMGIKYTSDNEIIEFFQYIGVNKYPKIEVKEISDIEKPDYLEFAKTRFNYPLDVGDCHYNNLNEFNNDYKSSLIRVSQIDLFNEILEVVPTQYIIDWFIDDENMRNILDKGVEPTLKSNMDFILGYKSNPRCITGNNIPAYILWKLLNSKWIDVKSSRVTSKNCCLARNSGIDMSPLVEYPSLNKYVSNINEKKNKNKKRELYEELLIKAGVASEFSQLDEKMVYSILMALPTLDPEGHKAKSFYRQIIQNTEVDEWNIDANTFENFKDNGKVFAIVNNKKEYRPVSEVYYLDDKTVCRAVVDCIPLFDLDKRKGKEKVERIFGVKPFRKTNFKIAHEPIYHRLNSLFKNELKSYLPYVYCYRYDKDAKGLELNRLLSLDINLCTSISVIYENREIKIDDFEYVEFGKNLVFLKVSNNFSQLKELKETFEFQDAIAEIISSSIDIEGNRKDYRELFAKTISDRKKTILSDFDNPHLLGEVMRLLKQDYDEKNSFWINILKALKFSTDEMHYTSDEIINILGLDKTRFDECNSKINFDDLTDYNNSECFISLFKQLKLDVNRFNEVSSEKISVCKYHEKEFLEIKFAYESKYALYLYNVLCSASFEEKQSFNKRMGEYRGLNITFEDSVKVNVKSILFKMLNIDLDLIEERDLNTIYNEHKQEFKKTLVIDDAPLNEFLDNPNYDSLLYFGEYIELQKHYIKYIKKNKENEVKYTGQNLADVVNEVKQNGYDFEDIDNPTIGAIESKGQNRNKKGPVAGFIKNKNTEKIGLKGERYVYALLKSKYKKVDWISENAKLDDVNAQGAAGTGYDMSYIDENQKRVYVEVKTSTGDGKAFYMSSNELTFAEDNTANYEIVLVTNINETIRKFNRYRNLFSYSIDESRFLNSKFRLDAKEYRIYTSNKDAGVV